MASDFADLKSQNRRVVMDTLGVLAFYQDNTMSAAQEIRARWHSKIDRFGDLAEQQYAEVVEGIDRVILFPCDYPTLNFCRGGVVTFPKYGLTKRLEYLEPSSGPLEAAWRVVDV